MTERSTRELEHDVEEARERLLSHLSVLSSPVAYSEFKEDLKDEARFTLRGILDDVKRRAAANPAATLAIGAGLAWRFIREPPISTALIGAGLYSLWRTTPVATQGRDFDYLSTAKTRLAEQVSDLATTVGEQTAHMAETVTENASQLAGVAKGKMQEWGVSSVRRDCRSHSLCYPTDSPRFRRRLTRCSEDSVRRGTCGKQSNVKFRKPRHIASKRSWVGHCRSSGYCLSASRHVPLVRNKGAKGRVP